MMERLVPGIWYLIVGEAEAQRNEENLPRIIKTTNTKDTKRRIQESALARR